MLAFLSSTRGAKGVSRHVRTLSTIAPNASFLDAGAEQTKGTSFKKTVVRRRQKQLASSSAECMYVYPWDGIRSSADGLAIARAVQEKFGPAKEVIFPRDAESVTVFQPYFWLVFDNPDVRQSLPEKSAQIRVRIVDLPRGDGNVGVEEMIRGLGLSTDKGLTAPKPRPSAEGEGEEGSADVADASDGHRTLDVRVEWARFGPNEVLQRRRTPSASLHAKALIPDFAAAWVAFDGFSPEAARGAHTPNLFRAREKWRALAPSTGDDPKAATPTYERASEVEPEPAGAGAGADIDVAPPAVSREWVPIIPLSPSLAPRRTTVPPQKSDVDIRTADDLAPISVAPAAAAPVIPTSAPPSTSTSLFEPARTEIPVESKMSRRERILYLARQNAQTPLPELEEQPQAAVGADKPEGESEQEGKERTIRERLWRLVGGNY